MTAERLLSALHLKDDVAGEGCVKTVPSSDDLLDAFRPHSPWSARSSAVIAIARQIGGGDGDGLPTSSVQRLLTAILSDDGADAYAAMRLVAACYTFASEQASHFCFRTDFLRNALRMAVTRWDVNSFTSLALAELLCAACSHPQSRTQVLKVGEAANQGEVDKIVEVSRTQVDGVQGTSATAMAWLVAAVERAELENPSAGSLLLKVGLLAALTLYKLTRLKSASKTDDLMNTTPKNPGTEQTDTTSDSRKAEEVSLIFELCKRQLSPSDAKLTREDASGLTIEASSAEEMQRLAHISALESLSYITMENPMYRDLVAGDAKLLNALHALSKQACNAKEMGSRYAFPLRGTVAASDETRGRADRTVDTAMQYALAVLFATVAAPRPSKSTEERQMAKLRRMANAQAADDPTETDEYLAREAVEERVVKLIEANIVEALVVITLSKDFDAAAGLNPSQGVRTVASRCLSHFTSRQDKAQRGKIIEQGGAKALLALSNAFVSGVEQSSGGDQVAPLTHDSFLAVQALAQLLVTADPTIALTSPIEAIRPVGLLYLHSDASTLQHFEAALALTNIASLGMELAQRVARCSFSNAILEGSSTGQFVGAGRGEDAQGGAGKESVSHVLRQRILLEENEMSRRASLELLCNLLVVDDVFSQWSGEAEDGGGAGTAAVRREDRRSAKDIVILIALCGPAGIDRGTGESGLKTRLAAGAVIATLCASASTCCHLLALGPTTIAKVCRLMKSDLGVPEHKIVEVNGEDDAEEKEKEDAQLHQQDINSDPQGPAHAQAQLELRALTAIECLVDFVAWLRGQGTNDTTNHTLVLRQSGAPDAVQHVLRQAAQQLKAPSSGQSSPPPSVRALQTQVAKQALGVLQKMQGLNLLKM